MRAPLLLLVTMPLAGCYHATIDTGLTPSGESVEVEWAHGFVYGLVPPSTVETASRCPNGVARVDTQLSFLNQLASFLTFWLYTPMTIEVQCATAGSAGDAAAIELTDGATAEQWARAIHAAARHSARTAAPVFITD
ncbi:MAG: Bor family protein [Longimicrobiales bacterium]